MQKLQTQFPDREVIAFDTKAIINIVGGIHCNNQLVPKRKN